MSDFYKVGLLCLMNTIHLFGSEVFLYKNFDRSMGVDLKNYTALYESKCKRYPTFSAMHNSFRSLYEKNNPSELENQDGYRIPKIIHQIWLGSELPKGFSKYVQTWVKYHPTWSIILWTDTMKNRSYGVWIDSLEKLNHALTEESLRGKILVVDIDCFNFQNKAFFYLSENWGEKSDIIRYELLEEFGGAFVDSDFECLKSFDILHCSYDFFAAIMPIDKRGTLANGLFGSAPHHPILKGLIERLPENWYYVESLGYTDYEIILQKTGPIYFQKVFYDYTCQEIDPMVIAFPASYFFPTWRSKDSYSAEKNPESFAWHHWGRSWVTPELLA